MHYTFYLLLLVGSAIANQTCQQLQLPWGTYNGTIDSSAVCRYKNVRFASPPLGDLRFASPKYPPDASDPQIPQNVDISCIATKLDTPCGGQPGEGCLPQNPNLQQSEDCLFLDIYVPISAFTSKEPLPVIVWIYGGAFIAGSKNQANFDILPLYDGSGIVSSQNSAIFVTGNYRLGAFGWLAGAYMEKKAQPNAGLLDQRAMLSFVQDQISQVYGDPSRVSVWGESAGASSIMHHLVMPQDKPLFRNALLQSPAYQWLWDRAGSLNDTYTTFAQIAGCTDGDIDCLRDLPISNLTAANQDLFQNQAACNGIMPVGPSVDGKLVTDLAVNLINDGQGMNLESILVSHVDLEVPYSASLKGMSFIPYPIRKDPQNADKFNDFLDAFADGSQYADIKTQIQEQYPVQGTYPDQIARAAAVIANSSFLCHTRFLIDAYQPEIPQNTFALHYAFGTTEQKNAAVHGSDLPPLFRRKDSEYQTMLSCLTGIKNSGLANKTKLNTLNGYIKNFVTPGMQTYFVNQAVGNNPGKQRGNLWSPVKDAVPCPSGDGTCVGQVMKAVTVLPWSKNNTTDPLTSSSYCDFWKGIAKDIMKVAKQLESAMGAEIDDSSQLVLKEL